MNDWLSGIFNKLANDTRTYDQKYSSIPARDNLDLLLERRIDALEAKLENSDGVVLDSRSQSLEPIIDCIAALEGRATSLEANRAWHQERAAALEAVLAKQRAVNEALLAWSYEIEETGGVAPPEIIAALREALK